jgi:nucleotide-binding universal stress UspA family protein
MTPWKRICCAVDLAEPSRIALLKAAELAARFEGELVLVHVHPYPPVLPTDLLVSTPELRSAEVAAVESTLARWRDEAERVSGRPVRTALLAGDPATEIVGFARERGFDVLVLATHGRTGLGRLVLGSVAEKVARAAPCTVVVARRPEAAARVHPGAASRREAAPAREGS